MAGINFLPFFILFSVFDYAVSASYYVDVSDSVALGPMAIIGIVIGGLIFLGILYACISALCGACFNEACRKKRAIYPTQGVNTTANSDHQTYPYPTQAGYTVNTNAANFQADGTVPPLPSYNAPSHPPPKNEPMN